MLGKKIVQFLRGNIGTHLPQSNREIYLQSKVKIGFGIILIGASCPLFWFSFLSGVRGIALLFSSVELAHRDRVWLRLHGVLPDSVAK